MHCGHASLPLFSISHPPSKVEIISQHISQHKYHISLHRHLLTAPLCPLLACIRTHISCDIAVNICQVHNTSYEEQGHCSERLLAHNIATPHTQHSISSYQSDAQGGGDCRLQCLMLSMPCMPEKKHSVLACIGSAADGIRVCMKASLRRRQPGDQLLCLAVHQPHRLIAPRSHSV